MASIVEQLQTDALNSAVPASTLLRKVKLAAVKLKLPAIEQWVDFELNGYVGEVPSYRKKAGRPRVLNPINGWIPLQGPHAFISMLSKVEIRQTIASLESLLEDRDQPTFYLPFPPQLVEEINRRMTVAWPEMAREIGRSQIAEILDRVRTLVLDWALELERQGILGTEVGFGSEEKERAQEKQVQIHIGSIANFTGSLTADVSGSASRFNVATKDLSMNKTG